MGRHVQEEQEQTLFDNSLDNNCHGVFSFDQRLLGYLPKVLDHPPSFQPTVLDLTLSLPKAQLRRPSFLPMVQVLLDDCLDKFLFYRSIDDFLLLFQRMFYVAIFIFVGYKDVDQFSNSIIQKK